MKKTIIQHYIDSLSFESQLGLLKCWCFAINDENWKNNVFTFNENDDLQSYFEYIKEYIKGIKDMLKLQHRSFQILSPRGGYLKQCGNQVIK